MRILMVHRYYSPDTAPCGKIMACIAEHLANDGHHVDVLTSQPSYRSLATVARRPSFEEVGGVGVRRLPLRTEANSPLYRVVNAFYLGIYAILKAVSGQYDAIVVASVPPVLGPYFAALAAKMTRTRFIYYCMDLHPEVGKASGDFANPLLFKLLQRLDDWACRRARPLLVHSVDMKNTMLSRPRGREYLIDIMNNFSIPCDGPVAGGALVAKSKSRKTLRVVYAGNVGRFQGLENIVEAMGQIADRRDIELVIMGDGVAKDNLIASQKRTSANIVFMSHQPASAAKNVIRSADLGLVSLAPGIYRYAYPSKVMAYLEQKVPIIAAVEIESELAITMQRDGYGLPTPIDDPKELARLLVRLANDKRWKPRMTKAAGDAYKKSFSAERVLAKWSNLFKASVT